MRVATIKELGDAVRAARRRHHMTQEELAQRSGVSRFWLVNLEHGRANPTWDVVSRLASVLDLELVIRDRQAPASLAPAPGARMSGEGQLTVGGVDLDAVVERHREGTGPASSTARAAKRGPDAGGRDRT